MIEVDSQMKMIIANLNDKLASITNECYKIVDNRNNEIKEIEWDIKVLRGRVDKAMKEEKNGTSN